MTDLPTPLTDKAAFCGKFANETELVVNIEVSRNLERRLAAARKLLAEARDILPMDMRVYERVQEAINHLTP